MAFLGQHINNDAEPMQDFAPIPSGEYQAIVSDSDFKPTKNNAGQYLELVYDIAEGPLKGRKVWARLNLDNPSQQTVDIAQRQLASIRAACGLQGITDSAQLHNIPHVIRVEFIPAGTKRKDGTSTQKDGNEIKAWKRIEGAVAQPSTFPGAPAASTAAPAGAKPAPTWAAKQAAA